MKKNANTVMFNLAPRNPNVNGIYYDKESYNKALSKFLSVNQPLYDRYDNDTNYYKSDSHNTIGVISNYIIDDDDGIIEVRLDERLKFITNKDYVIGFKLITKGNPFTDENGHKRYIIDKILYATLINKEFL